MVILVLFLGAMALRGLIEQTERDLDRWRGNHPARPPGGRRNRVDAGRVGYWANQARHAFPGARHGLAMGWYQASRAHHQTQAQMLQAQAEHAEHQLTHAERAREFRRRRAEAMEEIRRQAEFDRDHDAAKWEDQARTDHPEWFPVRCRHEGQFCARPGTGSPLTCTCTCAECASAKAAYAAPGAAPDDDEPDWSPWSWGREDRSYFSAADSEEQGRRFARQASQVNHGRYAVWEGLVQVAVYENGAEAGTDLPPEPQHEIDLDPDENPDGTTQDQQGKPEQPAGQPDAGGTMSETTYAGVKARMTRAQSDAEGWAADAKAAQQGTEEHASQAGQAKAWAQTTEEQMQVLKVDAAVLGAMADHQEALAKAEKLAQELNENMGQLMAAWQQVQETAGTVNAQMDASGHGGVQEARDNAAGGGAEKEFYGEAGTDTLGRTPAGV